MMLRAVDIHKSYRRGPIAVHAVRGVSLTIAAGETVAIVGPSGSGKSTLLNLLGGLDRPTSGEIYIDGVLLSGLQGDELTRLRGQKIGLVFQFFNLLPLLSANENVALPLLLAGVPPDEAEQRAAALLDDVGLRARMHHMPDAMSGGEMQRVAVARALSTRPALLLADEPTGNLDSASGIAVVELLTHAARQHRCGVLVITHDLRAAGRADRVLEFKDGLIQREMVQCVDPRTSSLPGEPACAT